MSTLPSLSLAWVDTSIAGGDGSSRASLGGGGGGGRSGVCVAARGEHGLFPPHHLVFEARVQPFIDTLRKGVEIVRHRLGVVIPGLVERQSGARAFEHAQQPLAAGHRRLVDQGDRLGQPCRGVVAAHLARQAHAVLDHQPQAERVGEQQTAQQHAQDLTEQRARQQPRRPCQSSFSTGPFST